MAEPTGPAGNKVVGSAKSRATRDALVELAGQMFAEQGYLQTSIRDIARRGGVTSGAIYGHFRNKADLLAATIHARMSSELESQSMGLAPTAGYADTLARLAGDFGARRMMRALLVQGAAAALTDEETRTLLREEQLHHLGVWLLRMEEERDRLGIDRDVDLHDALLYTWAAEVGLGVLEAVGLEPRSAGTWADVHDRLARGLMLPPAAKPPKAKRRTTKPTTEQPRTTKPTTKQPRA